MGRGTEGGPADGDSEGPGRGPSDRRGPGRRHRGGSGPGWGARHGAGVTLVTLVRLIELAGPPSLRTGRPATLRCGTLGAVTVLRPGRTRPRVPRLGQRAGVRAAATRRRLHCRTSERGAARHASRPVKPRTLPDSDSESKGARPPPPLCDIVTRECDAAWAAAERGALWRPSVLCGRTVSRCVTARARLAAPGW